MAIFFQCGHLGTELFQFCCGHQVCSQALLDETRDNGAKDQKQQAAEPEYTDAIRSQLPHIDISVQDITDQHQNTTDNAANGIHNKEVLRIFQ